MNYCVYLLRAYPHSKPPKPDLNQITRVLRKSEKTWYTSIEATKEKAALPNACYDPSSLLKRVPAMPDGSFANARRLAKDASHDVLSVYGSSSWEITGSRQCRLGRMWRNTGSCSLSLGYRTANPINFGVHSYGFNPNDWSNYKAKAMVTPYGPVVFIIQTTSQK